MLSDTPQNPLYERYASPEMARIFSSRHRFKTWRRLWISLAECESELGLPITTEQIAALRAVADDVDLDRVAEIERRTRHDVVAHIRHYAEQADRVHSGAGGIIHLGATSAFITDNTDVLLIREALELLAGRLAATIQELAGFARRTRAIPTLAYTHFQPAQLTTVGKRACLWLQDFLMDLAEIRHRLATVAPSARNAHEPGAACGLRLAKSRIATALVGPAIMCRLDPNSAERIGGTIAEYRPYCGGSPARIANATPCGSPSIAPVRPASRSARVVLRSTNGHQRRKGSSLRRSRGASIVRSMQRRYALPRAVAGSGFFSSRLRASSCLRSAPRRPLGHT